MPTPRDIPAACVFNGKVYVIGGLLVTRGPAVAMVEVYDPETDTWERKADMPKVRVAQAIIVNELIYLFGGATGGGGIAQSTFQEYNPEADTWRVLDDMPSAF